MISVQRKGLRVSELIKELSGFLQGIETGSITLRLKGFSWTLLLGFGV